MRIDDDFWALLGKMAAFALLLSVWLHFMNLLLYALKAALR